MTEVDTDKFRLRHFVEKLVQQGECDVHDDPIDLIDVASVLDGNRNAVWFGVMTPAQIRAKQASSHQRVGVAMPRCGGSPSAFRR